MSEATKQAAKEAGNILEKAKPYLEQAVKQAQKSGDKKLVERVTKVDKEVREIKTEIDTKTSTEHG